MNGRVRTAHPAECVATARRSVILSEAEDLWFKISSQCI
jgi:hypothetical protein